MLTVPAVATVAHARLYGDDTDGQLLYVDLLEPAPVRGPTATRWLPIPEALAYLVGEVRFGPGAEGFGAIPAVVPGQRLLPMPWASAPVYAWYRQGDGVQLVAQGKTSGFGQANAVFNGTAPLSAMISPVLVAAALTCPARLVGGEVQGSGRADQLAAALPQAALGAQADWAATLGTALIAWLEQLLASGALALRVQADAAATELRTLALLEWAQRLQQLIAPDLTLAAPAALVNNPMLPTWPDLAINWTRGSSIPLRTIRILRPQQLGRAVPEQ